MYTAPKRTPRVRTARGATARARSVFVVFVVLASSFSVGCGGGSSAAPPIEDGDAGPDARSGGAAVEDAAARRFVEAVNAGDVEAFAASFAPDAVAVDSGRRFDGREEIVGWAEREIFGVDGRVEVLEEEPTPDGTVLTVDFESRGFLGNGLSYDFATRDGLIQNLTLGSG